MVILEYFNGDDWEEIANFVNEKIAWGSLGEDCENYRTVNSITGEVLTSRRGGETQEDVNE